MSNPKTILQKFKIDNDGSKIDNIQWQTQNSNSTSILFYRFNNFDAKELQNFEKRMANCEFEICITNNSKLKIKSVIGLRTDEYNDLFLSTVKYFYPIDQSKIKLFGVTGTNGKTTTVDLLRQILIQKNKNVLTIGTLGIYHNNEFVKTFSLTTPSLIDIYKTIYEYQQNVDVVAIEVSSHALDQNRFGDIKFDAIGWTNLSQDHLDYHETMEKYFEAKLKIFNYLKKGASCFIPKDEKKLIEKIKYEVIPVEESCVSENLFLKPKYNKENLAIAKSIAGTLVNINDINYDELAAPPGRFNIINYNDSFIVIDFAHSPDGLLSISRELKKTFPEKKLVTLFGCGGDRDKGKRRLMGEAASKYAEKIFLTSDNPRFEDPLQIIQDIEPGISCDYVTIVQRSEAIKNAMSEIKNSILLIAGKGHEDYIDQNGIKTNYSDFEEVKRNLND